MPTLKEIKDMLVKAEKEAEAAVESALGVTPEAPPVDDAHVAVGSSLFSDPAVLKEEPVFVTEKAYGQVDGIPGVRYQQDGEYFDSQRKFVRRA